VCAGLADQFGVSVTALRLAVVILTFLGFGWGLLLYVVLWVIMPYRDGALPSA
jgi:phage shock protein PspC (stress-responsive transcriptional regulator)